MFKKITIGILLSVLIIGQFSLVSNAAGQSDDLTFHVNYTEPYCSEYCGYISVVFGWQGDYRLNTFFWSIVPDEVRVDNPRDFVTVMDISISGGKLTLSPFVLGGNYYFNLYEFGSTDALAQDMSGYYNYGNNPSWSYTYGADIVAYIFGGNVADVTAPILTTPVINWNNSPDAMELYDYLYQILSALNRVDIDTSDIVSRLSEIYSQNVSINEKLYDLRWMLAEQLVMINDELDAIYYQLDDLIKEQEKSNTWLEKIFNFLEEKDEKDKQQAETQGNTSISQGTASIEDKGAGFANSMGGLVSSMSYNGTQCAWTFPEVRLPAIAGVMEERVLIEEQPIDFSVWINAIPASILLLIQSLLTMGLIVYCFKELYGTISYVLTLRGGGSNE